MITLADETSENGQQENLHAMTVGMTGAPGRRRVVKSVQFDAIDRAAEIGGILRAGLKIRTPHGNIPASRARSQDRIDDLVLSKLASRSKRRPFCARTLFPSARENSPEIVVIEINEDAQSRSMGPVRAVLSLQSGCNFQFDPSHSTRIAITK